MGRQCSAGPGGGNPGSEPEARSHGGLLQQVPSRTSAGHRPGSRPLARKVTLLRRARGHELLITWLTGRLGIRYPMISASMTGVAYGELARAVVMPAAWGCSASAATWKSGFSNVRRRSRATAGACRLVSA